MKESYKISGSGAQFVKAPRAGQEQARQKPQARHGQLREGKGAKAEG